VFRAGVRPLRRYSPADTRLSSFESGPGRHVPVGRRVQGTRYQDGPDYMLPLLGAPPLINRRDSCRQQAHLNVPGPRSREVPKKRGEVRNAIIDGRKADAVNGLTRFRLAQIEP
jgi:hypothetical protein